MASSRWLVQLLLLVCLCLLPLAITAAQANEHEQEHEQTTVPDRYRAAMSYYDSNVRQLHAADGAAVEQALTAAGGDAPIDAAVAAAHSHQSDSSQTVSDDVLVANPVIARFTSGRQSRLSARPGIARAIRLQHITPANLLFIGGCLTATLVIVGVALKVLAAQKPASRIGIYRLSHIY